MNEIQKKLLKEAYYAYINTRGYLDLPEVGEYNQKPSLGSYDETLSKVLSHDKYTRLESDVTCLLGEASELHFILGFQYALEILGHGQQDGTEVKAV